MAKHDYDLFVIGAGSGGVRAARMAATAGAKVGIAEDRFFGGTCVNIGCVPKKLMLFASHMREEVEDAAGYGWTVEGARFDWNTLIANKNVEIARLNGVYVNLLNGANVDIHEARATIAGPCKLDVGGKQVTADKILVATGGHPLRDAGKPGAELGIVSDDFFHLPKRPDRALVLGGGYIAVEFAGILNGLGTEVTQMYRGPMFLRGFDDDIRNKLHAEMGKKGVEILLNSTIEGIEASGGGLKVACGAGETRAFDTVIWAIGRRPNTVGLGLENAGVDLNDKGAIVVDERFKSSCDSIFALGDAIDRVNLTPVAIEQAMVFVDAQFKGAPRCFDYGNIPSAVFSQPAIGAVGVTERQARDGGEAIDVYVSEFQAMKYVLPQRDERTLMKLIVRRSDDRVIGAHMIGADAAEIIQGVGIALKAGATKAQFDATIGIHPTSGEEFVTMRQARPEPRRGQDPR